MNMFKNLIWLLVAASLMTACSKVSHRKTPGGMPYQLFKGKGGEKIYSGNFVKVRLTQKIQDSVYFTTDDKIPIYIPVREPQPYDISEAWTKLRVGDSIVAIQMMDTFINRKIQLPPNFKKGDRIVTYVKILDVFDSDSLVKIDEKKTQEEFLATEKKANEERLINEIKFMEKWLADKKITAQKTPSGAFVETLTPGTGNLVDSGNYISVNYTGTSFSGVKFDSNTDTSFHHVEPYSFTVGAGGMIKGFDEGVRLMRKGGKAKIYIPSVLAYGARPNSPLIKAYEHLIFDIAIVDIKDKDPGASVLPQRKIDMPQPK